MRRNLKTSMEVDGLISVLMPLYNAEAFVEEAIESVLSQTYEQWELIIVNDGSTDRSLELAKQFESDKIHVLTQPNSGACVARNRAIREAKGQYIKFLDADDVLASECLSVQICQIQELSEHQIPFGDYDFIDSEGNQLYDYAFEFPDELRKDQEFFFYSHWEVLITSPLHRKSNLEQIGGFDEELPRGQEYDLHFRLANAGCEFVYCPVKTFSYRSHNSASRISTGTKKRTYETKAYLAYMYDKFENLLVERHGQLPSCFEIGFFLFWFGRSRDAYARGLKSDGNFCMKHAARYVSAYTSFFKLYRALGSVMGFVPLEKVFRLRVQLLGKDKKVEQPTGIARYL